MTSDDRRQASSRAGGPPAQAADGAAAPPASRPDHRGTRRVTDARTMRALAHPVRLALLEALAHAGTLTATQASELLGESPANCAFHLRTLARYGYVEEAGGGRGRERPWRRAHIGLQISSGQEDPQAASAAREVVDFWLDRLLGRARAELSRRPSWPPEWRGNAWVGAASDLLYLTPAEASELSAEFARMCERFDERLDHPERRPPEAVPIELIKLAYPLLQLAAQLPPAPARGAVVPQDPRSE